MKSLIVVDAAATGAAVVHGHDVAIRQVHGGFCICFYLIELRRALQDARAHFGAELPSGCCFFIVDEIKILQWRQQEKLRNAVGFFGFDRLFPLFGNLRLRLNADADFGLLLAEAFQ